MRKINNPWLYNIPVLDLHGEVSSMIRFIVDDFINDNYLLGKSKIYIVHGKSKYILKDTLYELLKENKKVISYKLDPQNLGATIVNITEKKLDK